MKRGELDDFYRSYLRRCNEHRFDELGEFVDGSVEVNGVPHETVVIQRKMLRRWEV